jgi:hypothetical protein
MLNNDDYNLMVLKSEEIQNQKPENYDKWIPDLNYLYQMLNKDLSRENLVSLLMDLAWYIQEDIINYNKPAENFDEILLCFYMKTQYNKIWNKNKWETSI